MDSVKIEASYLSHACELMISFTFSHHLKLLWVGFLWLATGSSLASTIISASASICRFVPIVRESIITQGAHCYTENQLLHRVSIITQRHLLHRNQLLDRESIFTQSQWWHKEIITQRDHYYTESIITEGVYYTESFVKQRVDYYPGHPPLYRKLLHRFHQYTGSQLLHRDTIIHYHTWPQYIREPCLFNHHVLLPYFWILVISKRHPLSLSKKDSTVPTEEWSVQGQVVGTLSKN